MFLTEEEFVILSSIKIGLSNPEIKEKFGIPLCTNDPRVDSLFQKYGANDKVELIENADLRKVEVCTKENIPYFEYDKDMQLVKKIPVCKKDVERLMKIFENVQDEEEIFSLVYCSNTLNEYLFLEEYVYKRLM